MDNQTENKQTSDVLNMPHRQYLTEQFYKQFQSAPSHVFFAPGRVNLIGEHIDYNGGHVFPCALDVGTYALVSKRNDSLVRLYSENFPEHGVVELSLDQISYEPKKDWANYPAGVMRMILDRGHTLKIGLNILFFGNIPNGAGLSSSASIELVTAVMLNFLFDLSLTQIELVKISQQAENQFNGMNCGIMDQFASGMGRADHAMLLNTNTLSYQHVPFDLGDDHVLLIANTNKRRELSDSKYNERRAECDAALTALQKELSINALCELTTEVLAKYIHLIDDAAQRLRVFHAVSENERTLAAVDVLQQGDLHAFGELMNASHVSLRDNYAVTGEHLDALVNAAWQHGAIGARMTGAGFGGCTVMLVEAKEVETFKTKVNADYKAVMGIDATFYDVRIGGGAHLLGMV